MTIKVPALIFSTITLLLSGCSSSPQYTQEQLAQGVPIKGFKANIPLNPTSTRARNVSHVFGNLMNDVDPDKKFMNTIEDGAISGFAHGVVQGGLATGLGAAAIASAVRAISYNRSHYDEWNAILDPAKYTTIYEAQAHALDLATELTVKGLEKQGYKTIPTLKQHFNQEGSLGKWYDNVLVVVNEKKGCAKPKSAEDKDVCRVVLRTLFYNAASREAPPMWLSDLNDAFIIRSLGVLPDGKTIDGKAFNLSRADREAIAREASNNFYFVGAFDRDHAGFVGENGKVEYCHLLPDELAKARERDKKGFAERLSDNVKQNYEKHGWKSILGIKPLFSE